MSGVSAFLNALLPYVPLIMTGMADVMGMVTWGLNRVSQMTAEKRDPTDAEWDELNRRIAAYRTRLYSTE